MLGNLKKLIKSFSRRYILEEVQKIFDKLQKTLMSKMVEINAGQDEITSRVNSIVSNTELVASQAESVVRGLAMTLNQQNQILERLDDIEAILHEKNKGKNCE